MSVFGAWLTFCRPRGSRGALCLVRLPGTLLSIFLNLEELYYLIMGIQYPLTPLLITETSPLSAE